MAIFTGGLASGIDSGLIIERLVQMRSTTIDQLAARQRTITAQISAIGDLASRLGALRAAAEALAGEGVSRVRSTGTHAAFEATPGTGAEPGRWSVAVEQLATAARLHSQAFDGSDALVAAGTLAFSVQGEPFEIEIAAGQKLAEVAATLNESGAPIRASLVNDGTKTYLTLVNRETGHPIGGNPDEALVVVQTLAGGTGQALFAGDASSPVEVRAAATNARIVVDGLPIERRSNAIDDVVPGVTLELLRAGDAASPEALVLSTDAAASRESLDAFVSAWAELVDMVRALRVPPDGTVGLLSSDASVRGLQAELEAILSQTVGAGSIRTLADLGLALGRDGKLSVDEQTFEAALAADPRAVDGLFQGEGGIAAALGAVVDRHTDPDTGILTTRREGLDATRERMAEDIERKKAAIEIYRETLIRQFTALERIVSEFDAIGRFLEQQDAAREKK